MVKTPCLQKKIIFPWISFIFKKTCTFKKSGYNQVHTIFSNISELPHRSEKVIYHKINNSVKRATRPNFFGFVIIICISIIKYHRPPDPILACLTDENLIINS